MLDTVDNRAIAIADPKCLTVVQGAFHSRMISESHDDRAKFLFDRLSAAHVIEVTVGEDHLFDRPFSHTGIHPAHGIDDARVHPGVDERVDIFQRISVPAHQIGVRAVGRRILWKPCDAHRRSLSP